MFREQTGEFIQRTFKCALALFSGGGLYLLTHSKNNMPRLFYYMTLATTLSDYAYCAFGHVPSQHPAISNFEFGTWHQLSQIHLR